MRSNNDRLLTAYSDIRDDKSTLQPENAVIHKMPYARQLYKETMKSIGNQSGRGCRCCRRTTLGNDIDIAQALVWAFCKSVEILGDQLSPEPE